jgi:hypothetical protein
MSFVSISPGLAQDFSGKGKQSDVSGTFDCFRDLALVFGAGAGLATRADFTVFEDQSFQFVDVLVIDFDAFIGTETTVLGTVIAIRLICTHVYTPLEFIG